jgi:hypothetical protein
MGYGNTSSRYVPGAMPQINMFIGLLHWGWLSSLTLIAFRDKSLRARVIIDQMLHVAIYVDICRYMLIICTTCIPYMGIKPPSIAITCARGWCHDSCKPTVDFHVHRKACRRVHHLTCPCQMGKMHQMIVPQLDSEDPPRSRWGPLPRTCSKRASR